MTRGKNRASLNAPLFRDSKTLWIDAILEEALRARRDYLIHKARTGSPTVRDRLRTAIDDYAGEITGDRTALHSKTCAG